MNNQNYQKSEKSNTFNKNTAKYNQNHSTNNQNQHRHQHQHQHQNQSQNQNYNKNNKNFTPSTQSKNTVDNPLFLPDTNYVSIPIPNEDIIVEEVYQHVREVVKGSIYDFDIGEAKFRELIRSEKSMTANKHTIEPDFIVSYYVYQYVVDYTADGRNYAYTNELLLQNSCPVKGVSLNQTVLKWKRTYFPEFTYDLDGYLTFDGVYARVIFNLNNKVYEIVMPYIPEDPEYHIDYEQFGQNFMSKIQSNETIKFPKGTKFTLKIVSESSTDN